MVRLKWRTWASCAALGALAFLTGCASVTHGTSQSVTIETLTSTGQAIEGAECTVANDKSSTVTLSGQSTSVRRSGATLSIECTQAGQAPATGQATSRVNGGMVGNILVGGLIGAAIDSGTGAGFNYPSWMQLVFGEVRTFDRNSQTGDQPLAGLKIGETQLATAPAAVPAATTAVSALPETAIASVASAPPPPSPSAALPAPVASAPRSAEPATRVSMEDLKALLPAKP
ncbi:hypothetical protein QTI08_16150 [Variovorax sp. J22G40]|nr:hypothetical protein [Variovorax sp. J22G40]